MKAAIKLAKSATIILIALPIVAIVQVTVAIFLSFAEAAKRVKNICSESDGAK